jgi:hypothetical protein
VPPEGGNPVGIWEPDTLEPVYIELLDMEVIEDLVDSLHLESDIEGYFSFHVSETCSINAVLTVQPYVYLKGLPTPLVLEFVDTLKALGTYSVLDETVLILPMESGTFNLDTLGISQSGNRLELISLSNHFPYEGFTDVRYYMILKFNRLPETSQEALPALSRWRRKFRG